MKKQDITYQDKLNELRLDIFHPNNKGIVFVFLEGESDIRLFRKLFDLVKCKVETIPGGKYKLEDCVNELLKYYSLIIGIRDADFIHLENTPYLKANLFITDFHDMEMMLISEDEVFSALLFEHTSLKKDEHFKVRSNLMACIEQIGLFKWLNERENLEFKYDVGFQDLISFVNLEINFDAYFLRILSNSRNAKICDKSIILQKIKSYKNTIPNPYQLCNGHDFMKTLSKFIKENGDGKVVSDENISGSFRMAYTLHMFKKTILYYAIKSWADQNSCLLFE